MRKSRVVKREKAAMREATRMRGPGRGVRREGRRRRRRRRVWKARRVRVRRLLGGEVEIRRWRRKAREVRIPQRREATNWACFWWFRYLEKLFSFAKAQHLTHVTGLVTVSVVVSD